LKKDKYAGNGDAKATLKSPSPLAVWQADALLAGCALFWGLGFVWMKNALSVYPTFWLLFFRFTGGAVLMGACFFRRIAGASRSDLTGGVVIGLFLFMGMGIQTLGLNYTTAGKQAFITASYVIMVPLLLWGLRRVFPGWVAIGGALICFAGMGLLTSDVSGPVNIGDVLTTISALFFAAHIISIGYYAKNGDPFVLVFVQLLVSAVLSFFSGLAFNGPLVLQGTQALTEIACMIVLPTFCSFLFQNVGQKYTPPTHASIILSLESVFGVLCGILILKEVFTLRMIMGCCLIFAAVLLVELKKEG
jgi:drug/metabolite transporter (DMT)-like permease